MTPAVVRLALWLQEHPQELQDVLQHLGVPLLSCNGHTGCPGVVLWRTPSQTQYEWDGKGEDPNAPLLLCPACSTEVTESMDDQWAAYWAGRL